MPHHPTLPTLRTRARTMRSNQTEAEKALWGRLRDRRLMGLKFKRQVPIGRYIVDFVCLEKHLIVEVDGSQHVENEYDNARDAELTRNGFRTLRFWNNEVLRDIESVCEAIRAVVLQDNSLLFACSSYPSSVSFAATFSRKGRREGGDGY